MSTTLTNNPLTLTTPLPLTRHPARVYLRGLSAGSRPTMKQALDEIASKLTQNECDADTLNWAALTYQHTAAVQAALLEVNSPTTVKKKMAALRRVLEEARKLKLMDTMDQTRVEKRKVWQQDILNKLTLETPLEVQA